MPVKEINTEEKIANLEDKIARLQEQLSNKKTSAAKKAAQKQIKLLENKLNQLIGFNSLSVGDWVCNGQPDLPGQIVELKQENECYEAWVIWDNETAPKPYAPSILTKQNLDLFIWAWDNDDKALTRLFDRKKCDDFGTLLAYIKTFQSSIKKALDEPTKLEISKKIGLVHKQWNELVKDKFRKGDRVRYNNQNATIIEYQYAGALLYIQIKFDDGEYLLVSPENLELLCLAQQILNVEPTVTYPCTKEIAIASITRDRSLQQRVQLDWSTVGEYCEVLKNGEKLAPVQLVLDDRLVIGSWGGFSKVTTLSTLDGQIDRGKQDIWNWAVTLAFPDLGKEGNLGGIVLGMEPWVSSSSIDSLGEDADISFHVEAFYQYQITDNIAVTPGIVWITAPDNNDSNDDLIIGAIRTTFSF